MTAILPVIRQWERYSQTLPPNLIQSVEQTMEKGSHGSGGVSQRALFRIWFSSLHSFRDFFIDFLIYLIALFLISLELPKLRKKGSLLFKDIHLSKDFASLSRFKYGSRRLH
ncbi:hypothetical protein RCO48_36155 [Peribacillus frigoritolerans]|nr:hypothetical protein [Peribacillus frigoritolerans]